MDLSAACEWCGRAVAQNAEGRWYAVKGKERGYDPLTCDVADDCRHSPDAPPGSDSLRESLNAIIGPPVDEETGAPTPTGRRVITCPACDAEVVYWTTDTWVPEVIHEPGHGTHTLQWGEYREAVMS